MELSDNAAVSLRKVRRVTAILKDNLIAEERSVRDIGYFPCDYKKTRAPLPDASLFSPFPEDGRWGRHDDDHAWFSFHLDVPAPAEGVRWEVRIWTSRETVGWDAINPQFLLYEDGALRQGIDINHTAVPVSGAHDYLLYAYTCTPGVGNHDMPLLVTLRAVRTDVEKTYYDLSVPTDALAVLDKCDRDYVCAAKILEDATDLIDLTSIPSDSFFASVKTADDYLQTAFYQGFCRKDSPLSVVCIGHTHIDCAWKWTLGQSREKVQRSFSTVLELMRRYPEYKFMSSQALLYRFMKEEAPEKYEEIKARVREGRWEVEGAMWVEADCNLSSGESLVRQVVYGKQFFRREFGVECRVLWLPDVFGYSAALPQILKKANVDWFLTSKISWNDTNLMPCDTFSWQGIDGTSVHTYFLTAQHVDREHPIGRYVTYNGNTCPGMINGTYARYQQKDLSDQALLTYGFGDGGGGPTAEMLEMLRREENLPGIPHAVIGKAGDFLSSLDGKIRENPDRLPVWRGELYLEFHRGTYTTQARNKKNNRESEHLYRMAEGYSAMAALLASLPYPKEALHEGWLTILTNQFHDIIPGSSIHEVYEDSAKDYAALKAVGEEAKDRAIAALLSQIDTKKDVLVFNPTSHVYTGPVKTENGYRHAENIPAWGWAPLSDESFPALTVSARKIDTPYYLASFDANGNLLSLFDKVASREVLAGQGNRLEIYEDFPDSYDAWEISPYYKNKMLPLDLAESVEVFSEGVSAGLRITRRHMSSTITQNVRFYADSPRIDFETTVDWRERHQLLKAAFPVDVNSDKATYEIQFGTTERPTHTNTSWDAAKYEVCAQKFADLSDGGYGVSLLNNCKYGYDIHGNVMRLSLLRAPTDPDKTADAGVHTFTYALYPHVGAFVTAHTAREAYALNLPPFPVQTGKGTGKLPERYSFVSVDQENVIPETVKQAEDSDKIIVRLIESKNARTHCRVSFGFPVAAVAVADLEENEISSLPVENDGVTLTVRPFAVVTLSVTPM